MNLVDIVLILFIGCLFIFCLKSASKHFKGEGGCCGGGSTILPEEDKVLENPIIGNKIIKIEGMTCENCSNRVKRALNKLEGVSATVSLRRNQAMVSFDRKIDDELLKQTIENLDYKVLSIE